MAIAFEGSALGIHAPSLGIRVFIFVTGFSLVPVQSAVAQAYPPTSALSETTQLTRQIKHPTTTNSCHSTAYYGDKGG